MITVSTGPNRGDTVADNEADFSQVFRGYDKNEVDRAIQGLRRDLVQANAQSADASREVKRLGALVEELSAQLGEVGNPTFAGLGTKLENTLRVAEEQSGRVIAQAELDADKWRLNAEQEIEELRRSVNAQAERTLSDATVKAHRLLETAQLEADSLLSQAEAQQEVVTEDALREASAIRGAVATEAAELRATVKREVAAIRSEAERESAEIRVLAHRETSAARKVADQLAQQADAARAEALRARALEQVTLTREIEQSRLDLQVLEQVLETIAVETGQPRPDISEALDVARTEIITEHDRLRAEYEAERDQLRLELAAELEAARRANDSAASALLRETDQRRADLDAELKARRNEAEQEHLASHQEAVSQTQQYLEDSARQLAEMSERTLELRTQNEHSLALAREDARIARQEAANAANLIHSEAEAAAAALLAETTIQTRTLVATAEERLAQIRIERDSVAGYFENLRTLLAQAERVTHSDEQASSDGTAAS
jgi:DivIVA domain-containing protein